MMTNLWQHDVEYIPASGKRSLIKTTDISYNVNDTLNKIKIARLDEILRSFSVLRLSMLLFQRKIHHHTRS